VGLCYLVEGPARRFEACCQLTLADGVGVADVWKCGVSISGSCINRHGVARATLFGLNYL
jgi:hypothetical protein